MGNKVKFSPFDKIPQDILVQIFCKLPSKYVTRCSCVSTLWFNVINNGQEFNKFHMVESQQKPVLTFTFKERSKVKSYYLEKEEHGNSNNHKLLAYPKHSYKGYEDMVGYDNGLACYWKLSGRPEYGEVVESSLEIYNPSRLEKLSIASGIQNRKIRQIHGFRFGYDLLSDQYKVMCIMEYSDEYEYYIYTLGSTKPWRQIHNQWPRQHPNNFLSSIREDVPPISCNGNLFYEMITDVTEIKRYKRLALVSFDLHHEKFQIIKTPGNDEFVMDYNNRDLYPSEYKGLLCYSRIKTSNRYTGEVVLYILKDTIKQVWVKETIKFDLPRGGLHDPGLPASSRIQIFSSQVILYWKLNNKQRGHAIRFYNVHSKELKEVKIPAECYGQFSEFYISSYVENILSLRTLATTEEFGKNWYLRRGLFKVTQTIADPAVLSYFDPFQSSQKQILEF